MNVLTVAITGAVQECPRGCHRQRLGLRSSRARTRSNQCRHSRIPHSHQHPRRPLERTPYQRAGGTRVGRGGDHSRRSSALHSGNGRAAGCLRSAGRLESWVLIAWFGSLQARQPPEFLPGPHFQKLRLVLPGPLLDKRAGSGGESTLPHFDASAAPVLRLPVAVILQKIDSH